MKRFEWQNSFHIYNPSFSEDSNDFIVGDRLRAPPQLCSELEWSASNQNISNSFQSQLDNVQLRLMIMTIIINMKQIKRICYESYPWDQHQTIRSHQAYQLEPASSLLIPPQSKSVEKIRSRLVNDQTSSCWWLSDRSFAIHTTVVSSWVIVCVECVAVIVSVVAGGQREMFCYYFYCLPCRDLPSVSKHLQTSHHLPGPVPVMSLIDGGSLSGQKVWGTCPGDRDWEWMISGTERVRVFYNWSTSCLYYCRPN